MAAPDQPGGDRERVPDQPAAGAPPPEASAADPDSGISYVMSPADAAALEAMLRALPRRTAPAEPDPSAEPGGGEG